MRSFLNFLLHCHIVILADVKEKLKESIPDFDERLTTLDEQDQQWEQKM